MSRCKGLPALCVFVPAVEAGGIQQIVALLVDHVETRDQQVVAVHWSGSARPFFTADVFAVAPPDGLQRSRSKPYDVLAWYADAG
jgi:hypothetical protein